MLQSTVGEQVANYYFSIGFLAFGANVVKGWLGHDEVRR